MREHPPLISIFISFSIYSPLNQFQKSTNRIVFSREEVLGNNDGCLHFKGRLQIKDWWGWELGLCVICLQSLTLLCAMQHKPLLIVTDHTAGQ